ncbi:hypothetical protein BDY24DRAFT_117179 [Mrakia frigida]|uniref:uncharacterized protein n=1 Tax=Mrakia frigida TaxID=29902 RepID=UPI003FCC12B6
MSVHPSSSFAHGRKGGERQLVSFEGVNEIDWLRRSRARERREDASLEGLSGRRRVLFFASLYIFAQERAYPTSSQIKTDQFRADPMSILRTSFENEEEEMKAQRGIVFSCGLFGESTNVFDRGREGERDWEGRSSFSFLASVDLQPPLTSCHLLPPLYFSLSRQFSSTCLP